MPKGLDETDSMYWRAVDLSIRLPWFIASLEFGDGELAYLQSMCLSMPSDLLTLLEQEPGTKLRSLQCVCPDESAHPGWRIRDVAKVWRATEPTSQQRELVFEDGQGAHFSTWHADAAAGRFIEHELVIALPQRGSYANRRDRVRRSPRRGARRQLVKKR